MNDHIPGVGGSNDPFYLNDTTFRSIFFCGIRGPRALLPMPFFFALFIQRFPFLLFVFLTHNFDSILLEGVRNSGLTAQLGFCEDVQREDVQSRLRR